MRISNIVDIHSHILPAVDDGAANISESLKILQDMKAQGVTRVYATPHFYISRQPYEEYKEKINNAYSELLAATKDKSLPEIKLGAEVCFFRGIGSFPHLRELRLEGTDYVLIEFAPDTVIERWMIQELYNLQFSHGVIPIIAHIERYMEQDLFNELLELAEDENVLLQISTTAPNEDIKTAKKISELVLCGLVSFVASDAHSSVRRRPCFDAANRKLVKKCGMDAVTDLYSTANILMKYDKEVIFDEEG